MSVRRSLTQSSMERKEERRIEFSGRRKEESSETECGSAFTGEGTNTENRAKRRRREAEMAEMRVRWGKRLRRTLAMRSPMILDLSARVVRCFFLSITAEFSNSMRRCYLLAGGGGRRSAFAGTTPFLPFSIL